MREDIAEYVTRCDTCQRVKAEHQRPAGLLQPLEIPTWKWDDISMDFIVGLPRTHKGNDSVWVIVDRLTKVAHFLPVKANYRVSRLAELYVDNICRGQPKGSPLTTGKSPLKTRNKAKHTLPNHAGHGPYRRDLSGPPRRPS
jgi:hypothetical protein